MKSAIKKKLEARHIESSKEQRKRNKEVAALLKRFGKYLRQRREQENLSFREFAERARMAHSNIFVIEESKKDPHLSELVKMAQAFGLTLRQFLAPLLLEDELDAQEKFAMSEIGERVGED